jgi:serine/threonine protein kinase
VESKPITGLLLTNTIIGIIDALKSIHDAGVVHQDLKPSNVILGPNGVTVLDFGLSVIEEASNIIRPQDLGGTPSWISPEQVTGAKVTPASDVFNLGMLIAFLATGRNPFGVGKPEALLYRIANSRPDLQELDPHLRRIADACLAKEASERPPLEQVKSLLQGIDSSIGKSGQAEEDRTLLASRTSIARAFESETESPLQWKTIAKLPRKITAGIIAGLAALSLFIVDAVVIDYGGDIVFRYVNSSESNQPQTSSVVQIAVDDESKSITLPSTPTPKKSQQSVGRWHLGSTISVTATPSFTGDAATTIQASATELGLSRLRADQALIIEVELTDSRTNLRLGFGAESPLTAASVFKSSPRSNEAAILAEEAAEEEQFFAEQRRLYDACVGELEAGWLSELNPVLDLERGYRSLRDSYVDGQTRYTDEWASQFYRLSEAMFSQWLGTVSPARSESRYAPYSPALVDDAGFVFETHGYLSDSWANLADSLLYYPSRDAGNLRDLYPREYLFIEEFEGQLKDASTALRSSITVDAAIYCEIEFPEGAR